MSQKLEHFQVVYIGVWKVFGEEYIRVCPTLSEAIYTKQWVERQFPSSDFHWIGISALRIPVRTI